MGMFDRVRCKMPGPDPDATYQTKSLYCEMSVIVIDVDGTITADGHPLCGHRGEITFYKWRPGQPWEEWSALCDKGKVISLERTQ